MQIVFSTSSSSIKIEATSSKIAQYDKAVADTEMIIENIGLEATSHTYTGSELLTGAVIDPGTIATFSKRTNPIAFKKGTTIKASGFSGTPAFIYASEWKDGQFVRKLFAPTNNTTKEFEIVADKDMQIVFSTSSSSITIESKIFKLESAISEVAELSAGYVSTQKDYIQMPLPEIAEVNFITPSIPTTKTDDIEAVMVFNDCRGNIFKKNVILNAQGNSTIGLPKKNFSIDIVDEKYDDSHYIKFGEWVAQDSFHLKAYLMDGVRVKSLAAYDLYENILLTRGMLKDRAWKRLQLPENIQLTSNSISDLYLQLDSGAKNHPSGFPIIVSLNGAFYGVYCWQLKKHRDNYHQKKDNAAHIHLDGNIGNALLWSAGGVLDWNKWSGNEYESASIQNKDGIEIRNPKNLILTDGSKYDGDTNRGELITATSPNYDANNANMVKTASVRASLESLSSRTTAISAMTKGAEKKAELAKVFDIDSIIDYIIFGQVTNNLDGYKKNWQWVTYDGDKWAVNAYDLDAVWGWNGGNYTYPISTWFAGDGLPAQMVIENYEDEIKERYAELRRSGVLSLEKIMQPLVHYVKVVGTENFDKEFKKWTTGARDNLWRFEAWMKESLRLTDKLMEFVA